MSQLREKLRELGFSSTGNRDELINRLIEADPSGQWIKGTSEMPQASVTTQEDESESDARAPALTSQYEREIEMYRREKELAEREVQFARRELELVREMQRMITVERGQAAERGNIFHDSPKVSIAAIADLLSCFDGSVGSYEVWEKQLKLIKTTYHLADEYVKILIGMRSKGKASEWLQSKPQHIEMSVDDLLNEMREMYDHRPSKILDFKETIRRAYMEEGGDVPAIRP